MDNSLVIGLLLGAGAAYIYTQSQRRQRRRDWGRGGAGPRALYAGPDGGASPMSYAQNEGARSMRVPLHPSQPHAPAPPTAPMPDGTEGTLGGERF
jgi:hypothetical protein